MTVISVFQFYLTSVISLLSHLCFRVLILCLHFMFLKCIPTCHFSAVRQMNSKVTKQSADKWSFIPPSRKSQIVSAVYFRSRSFRSCQKSILEVMITSWSLAKCHHTLTEVPFLGDFSGDNRFRACSGVGYFLLLNQCLIRGGIGTFLTLIPCPRLSKELISSPSLQACRQEITFWLSIFPGRIVRLARLPWKNCANRGLATSPPVRARNIVICCEETR